MAGCCKACGRYLGHGDGIFCTNFSWKQGVFAPCEGCCCASCFKSDGSISWFVRKQVDEDGNVIVGKGDDIRFLTARKGDHLITPFQCPLCHF